MGSILGRFNLLFILFFLLIAVSVGATFWGLQAQAEDASVINLAGRQRMLAQQMTRLALEDVRSPADSLALTGAMEAFDETLQAFQAGGQVHYPAGEQVAVRPARPAAIRQQLERVDQVWRLFRPELETVLATPGPADEKDVAATAAIQRLFPQLVAEADAAVRLYQADVNQRIRILGWVQGGFFAGALALLAAGSLVVRRAVLDPLKRLGLAAGRIARGDLHTPVQPEGPAEIRLLTENFEHMRTELERSQEELLMWAATLEERVEERTKELNALHEVSREISSHLELRAVLNLVTDKTRELLKAETAFLCLLDGESRVLNLQSISGPEETVLRFSSPAEIPFVQDILSRSCAQRCTAARSQATCGIMDDQYRASHLAAPLWVGRRVIGSLCAGSRQPGAFSDDSQALLTRLANAAAAAIENARLYTQAERVAALEERQRIAADMHDGLAQMIDSFGLLLDQANDQIETGCTDLAAATLEGARQRVIQASAEVRRSIASLQDEPPRPRTIQELLKNLIRQVSAETDGQVEWQVNLHGEALVLRSEDAQQVIGIAQETLSNARRHSGATRIRVQLLQIGSQANLLIEDNGCGFDPTAAQPNGRLHFGLKILQARAAQIDGRLRVDSTAGKGTCISLSWPVRKPDLVTQSW